MKLNNLYLIEALDPIANAIVKYEKAAINVAIKLYGEQDTEETASKLLHHAIEIDPDPKKKNVGWLLKQVGNREVIIPEDGPDIQELLRRFLEQKRVGRLPEPDLNKHTIDSLRDTLDKLGNVQSKRQGGLGFDPTKMPGVETYAESGPWIILQNIRPTNNNSGIWTE